MKITLITTGGTINSEAGSASGIQLKSETAREMADWFDAGFLEERAVELSVDSPFSLHSEEMIPADWLVLGRSVAAATDAGAEAIVITHGTDTMSWSLAALSALLGKPSIPIIFTGARLPPAHPETDARRHLHAAFAWAAVSPDPDLYLVFSSVGDQNCYVLWGPSVTWDTNDPRLYLTRPDGELGIIDRENNIQNFENFPTACDEFYKNGPKKCKIPETMSEEGILFHLFPGFDPGILKLAFEQGGKKVILLNLYHSGTACTRQNHDLGPAIRAITQRGGRVIGWPVPDDPADRYASIVRLIEAGLIPANDLTLEMAYVRALLALPS